MIHMPTSYNGWYASPNLPTRPLVIAGESFVPGVLDDDDVFTVLQYVATQMHERVEPIVRADWHQADDWGFSYRESTGSDDLSCHASGTAIDYNATRHPYGVRASANFSPAQIAEIHRILDEVGVVVWGGDWNTPDAMHFEIHGTRAQVAAAAAQIRNREDDQMKPEDWDRLRSIVRDEVRAATPGAGQIAEAVWDEPVTLTEADTSEVQRPARQVLRQVWQKVSRHI